MLWMAWAMAGEPTGAALAKTLPEVLVTLSDADLIVVPGRKKKAPVVIQYSDWRCPHCLVALPQVRELVEARGAELRFRNFPLDGACNPVVPVEVGDRCALARISVCAHRSERFWELAAAAQGTPADLVDTWMADADIARCVETPDVDAQVTTQLRGGIDDGILGTPTFYVRVKGRWVDAQGVEGLARLLR